MLKERSWFLKPKIAQKVLGICDGGNCFHKVMTNKHQTSEGAAHAIFTRLCCPQRRPKKNFQKIANNARNICTLRENKIPLTEAGSAAEPELHAERIQHSRRHRLQQEARLLPEQRGRCGLIPGVSAIGQISFKNCHLFCWACERKKCFSMRMKNK